MKKDDAVANFILMLLFVNCDYERLFIADGVYNENWMELCLSFYCYGVTMLLPICCCFHFERGDAGPALQVNCGVDACPLLVC